MSVQKKRPAGPTRSRIIRSFIIIAVIAFLTGVSAKMAMDGLNKKMGLGSRDAAESSNAGSAETNSEPVMMPEFDPSQTIETGLQAWTPDWKTTPCSLFVTADSDALLDSLSRAPDQASRNTELQLLVELWAGHSGFEPMEIERVWVFASGDTCFVDLPRSADWHGIIRTIESRFISYTLLIPFVAGEIIEGFEEGIPVRGVASTR